MTDLDNREYELVYIVQPNLDDVGVQEFSQRMADLVVGQEGEIQNTELWGRRTLAYPINKIYEGHYVLQRFSMPPQGIPEIDRYLRYSEDVIRYMLVRTDE